MWIRVWGGLGVGWSDWGTVDVVLRLERALGVHPHHLTCVNTHLSTKQDVEFSKQGKLLCNFRCVDLLYTYMGKVTEPIHSSTLSMTGTPLSPGAVAGGMGPAGSAGRGRARRTRRSGCCRRWVIGVCVVVCAYVCMELGCGVVL